jgi:hypothetical protein
MSYNTALESHTFEVADIEHFAEFADWMQEKLPEADVTFRDKPMFGKPYVQVTIREIWERGESYTLMLDEGQTFNIGRTEAWISGDPAFDELFEEKP